MHSHDSLSTERAELLATLELALARSLMLARELAADPLVGTEAKGFLGRLECIQAEVTIVASSRPRRRPHNDEGERWAATRLWQ